MPVLLREVLDALDPRLGETALDCTTGRGGHAVAIAERLGPSGTMVINDLDPANLAASRARLAALAAPARVVELPGNFAAAPRRLAESGLSTDVLLADLGFSSSQVDDPSRGFSFQHAGPLDMRMDPSGAVTAAEIVNSSSETELARIISEYGEDREARRIARKLVDARRDAPIVTTDRLAQIVRSALGGKGGMSRIDPATRTFQALRIAVNDELGNLEALLAAIRRAAQSNQGKSRAGPSWLRPGARVCVISFHSLEDRPVKRAFVELVESGLATALSKGPVVADDEERASNPRSRSAKLRAIRLA